ncbi:uncharacterized protein [Antedon mediterranea]|uniref:uncharacterized protein isoform X2 n=1 Tax=Antedon mediterranea TaxID=105859 RepID=UPI003AF413E2
MYLTLGILYLVLPPATSLEWAIGNLIRRQSIADEMTMCETGICGSCQLVCATEKDICHRTDLTDKVRLHETKIWHDGCPTGGKEDPGPNWRLDIITLVCVGNIMIMSFLSAKYRANVDFPATEKDICHRTDLTDKVRLHETKIWHDGCPTGGKEDPGPNCQYDIITLEIYLEFVANKENNKERHVEKKMLILLLQPNTRKDIPRYSSAIVQTLRPVDCTREWKFLNVVFVYRALTMSLSYGNVIDAITSAILPA